MINPLRIYRVPRAAAYTEARHGTFVIESDDLVLDPAPFSKPIGGAR